MSNMKPLRTRLSPRQTLFCIGALVLLSCSLPFLSSPSFHQHVPQDESGNAISMTSVGPSAFASHLYRHHDSAACRPMGIRLAQASNVGQGGLVSMTVSLHLDYQACRNAVPTVVYGQGIWDKKTAQAKKALQFNYTSDESNGLFQSPWIWHVPLEHVKAGPQRYWYKIVVHQGQRVTASTPVFYFYTPPLPSSPTALALVGDLGQTENSTKTMQVSVAVCLFVDVLLPGVEESSSCLVSYLFSQATHLSGRVETSGIQSPLCDSSNYCRRFILCRLGSASMDIVV